MFFNKLKKYKNVCLVNSNYSLLLYFLIINNENNTLFIIGEAVSLQIRNKLSNSIYIKKPPRNKIMKFIYFTFYFFIYSPILKPFLIKKRFYGHDHVFFSNLLPNEFNVIEDGLGNYITKGPIHHYLMKRLIGIDESIGYSEKAKKIYLTGMRTIPTPLSHKAEIIDIKYLWEQKTYYEKLCINHVFGINNNYDIIDSLLLTQPLSEDGYVSEREKIDIYKLLLLKNGIKNIVIKQHPRDKTVYDFGVDIKVSYIPSYIPMELLLLNELKVNNVYTLYSSAIFLFDKTKINFSGTDELVDKYPNLPLIQKRMF